MRNALYFYFKHNIDQIQQTEKNNSRNGLLDHYDGNVL